MTNGSNSEGLADVVVGGRAAQRCSTDQGHRWRAACRNWGNAQPPLLRIGRVGHPEPATCQQTAHQPLTASSVLQQHTCDTFAAASTRKIFPANTVKHTCDIQVAGALVEARHVAVVQLARGIRDQLAPASPPRSTQTINMLAYAVSGSSLQEPYVTQPRALCLQEFQRNGHPTAASSAHPPVPLQPRIRRQLFPRHTVGQRILRTGSNGVLSCSAPRALGLQRLHSLACKISGTRSHSRWMEPWPPDGMSLLPPAQTAACAMRVCSTLQG